MSEVMIGNLSMQTEANRRVGFLAIFTDVVLFPFDFAAALVVGVVIVESKAEIFLLENFLAK